MAKVGTLVDLLLFYSLERSLFNRMVCKMGKNSAQVKQAIAFWLMIQEFGYQDLIRTIHSYDDNTVEAFLNEALLFLEYLNPDSHNPVIPDSLFFKPINHTFLYNHYAFMCKRFMHIMETVCDKIFYQSGAIEVDMSGPRPVPVIIRQNQEVSYLNPEASEFYPRQSSEIDRTLFLTFSKGHPLTLPEIIHFFNSKFGEVVEDVKIEHPREGQDPQFGRIVFRTSTVINSVLNGQSKAKFVVNRKHLWARPYLQRHGRTS